jgi:hypothetical protein
MFSVTLAWKIIPYRRVAALMLDWVVPAIVPPVLTLKI